MPRYTPQQLSPGYTPPTCGPLSESEAEKLARVTYVRELLAGQQNQRDWAAQSPDDAYAEWYARYGGGWYYTGVD